MLSRVAAVKASRTHNRRRVTGSSGRRREGRESERQRPNMSRRVFTSAVLLLLVMMCCGIGGGTAVVDVVEEPSSFPKFEWKDITEDGDVTVDSLGVPGLLKVGSDVFAVAEAQCNKNGKSVFTGIASKLLTLTDEPSKEEFDATQVKTQVLVECSSDDVKAGCRVAVEGSGSPNEKIVDVSRPTAVVNGSDIYMLVGKYCREDAADTCKATSEKFKSGILLVKGTISESGNNNKIHWKETDGVPCTLGEQQKTLTGLIGGGGSGVKMKDDTILFPVEGTKKEDGAEEDEKTVSLIIYSSDTPSCTLSKEVPADGCGDLSVVEWEKDKKLMMMTACDDGRRRVYESGDKGESWTEALGTLSRVWASKHEGGKGVRSGFITATIKDRDVMLVTLPVYSKGKEKGELRLWLTDNTHIVDIGSVSGDDDVAASSLLYKSGETNNEKLIALYEKKKGGGEKPSPGMVSVLLTAQLQRVKDVLTTWKEVDERVSKLCPSESAMEDTQTGNACSTTDKITDGLVGFLSSTSTDDKWKDEYLGVNATVNKNEGKVTSTENGATFTGAWAEWPVGRQGENQLYHFANYKFTLVATVSIHGVPKEGSIPLMGAKMDDDKTVLLGLSYNSQNNWQVFSSGTVTEGQISNWATETQYQVAIVLQNEKQCSAYVDGKLVGSAQCELRNADSKGISHFYIGGDGGSAEGQEGVSVTVRNVLLYNRPLSSEEIAGLAKNKITIPKLEVPKSSVVDTQLPAVSAPDVEGTVTQSPPSGPRQMKQETLKANVGGGAGGVSSAASVTTTPSSDASPTVVTVGGDTVRGNGSPQTPEESVSSSEDGETVEGTDAQGEEGIHPPAGEVNDTALNSSLGKLSQGNNSDACSVRGSGLLPSLLLLLGLWVFAAL
ncbi:putative trans-sialidase, Group V [Trypanosoma cruzi]|nr:putative trans-sialidase, Group V [Trypanosoma cruzi]